MDINYHDFDVNEIVDDLVGHESPLQDAWVYTYGFNPFPIYTAELAPLGEHNKKMREAPIPQN